MTVQLQLTSARPLRWTVIMHIAKMLKNFNTKMLSDITIEVTPYLQNDNVWLKFLTPY